MKRFFVMALALMLLVSCGRSDSAEGEVTTTEEIIGSADGKQVVIMTTYTIEEAEPDDWEEPEVYDEYYENIKSQSLILPKDVEVVDTYVERWFESCTEDSLTAKDNEEDVDLSDVFWLDQIVDTDTIYDVERAGDYIAFRAGSDMTAYVCKATDAELEVIAKGTGLSVGYAVTDHYIFFAEGYSEMSSSELRMHVLNVATGEIKAVGFPMPFENTFISTIMPTSDGGMMIAPNTGETIENPEDSVYYISPENIVINSTELFLSDEAYGFTYEDYETLNGKWDMVYWYDVPTVNESLTKVAYWSNKYAENGEMCLEPGIWIVDLVNASEYRLDLGDLSPTVGYINWIDDETLMFDTYDDEFYKISLADNSIEALDSEKIE